LKKAINLFTEQGEQEMVKACNELLKLLESD